MMMDDLTEDLVMEILSRVPATSLTRLRSTCKQWNSLFKDPKFIKKQFSIAAEAKQTMVVMLKETRVYLMNINLQGTIDPSPTFTLKDSFYNTTQFYIRDIFYCIGLLLCTTVFKESGKAVIRVVVWNPCLGQTKWIEPRSIGSTISDFALGYDRNNKSWESYKILRMSGGNHCGQKLEIYDSNINSWRYLDEDVVYDGCSLTQHGVSLNGNTYWLGYDKSEEDVRMVISFDFSTEEFRLGECPPPFQFSPGDVLALSVVREEQLSFLQQRYYSFKMEIWVTTNDKATDHTKGLLWSKFLSVDIYSRNLSYSYEVSFVIVDEEKKIVSCYYQDRKTVIGEEENGVIEVVLGEYEYCWPLMFGYVPSLVPI